MYVLGVMVCVGGRGLGVRMVFLRLPSSGEISAGNNLLHSSSGAVGFPSSSIILSISRLHTPFRAFCVSQWGAVSRMGAQGTQKGRHPTRHSAGHVVTAIQGRCSLILNA